MKNKHQVIKRHIGRMLLVCLLCLPLLSVPVAAQATALEAKKLGLPIPPAFIPRGGSVVTASQTGQILWQEDSQTPWVPSSITKVMVVYLAYKAMDQGRFNLDTVVTVSPELAELSTYFYISNNKMLEGATYTIAELIELVFLPSSSAATMALAWQMGLDHGQLVSLMNQTASDLGMADTVYYNGVGATNAAMGNFPAEGQPYEEQNQTTAQDIAILCNHLVTEFPDVLKHTSLIQKTFKPGTASEETFETYLQSLEGATYSLKGADGIKTGSGGASGYNISMTAKRGDTRLTGVLLGVGDWYDIDAPEYRSTMINAIFEKAFKEYEYRIVLPKGEHDFNGRTLVTSEDLWDIVPVGQTMTPQVMGDRIQLVYDRSFLNKSGPPSVSYIDPEIVAAEEAAVRREARQDFLDKVSPIVVVAMFVGFLGWTAYSHK